MSNIVCFVFGIMLGGILGVVCMSCFFISSRESKAEDQVKQQ